MATIAIGDVHGELEPLTDVLAQIEGDLCSDDTVVFLGDYIDRGPRSMECIERILEFSAATPSKVVTLLGNHEEWLLRTLDDPTSHSWLLGMDGLTTIESYSPDAAAAVREAVEGAEMTPLSGEGSAARIRRSSTRCLPRTGLFCGTCVLTPKRPTSSAPTAASIRAAALRISSR